MTYTSINHKRHGNFQIDHDEFGSFELWCRENKVIWAHLFEEETGQHVATFDLKLGLVSI